MGRAEYAIPEVLGQRFARLVVVLASSWIAAAGASPGDFTGSEVCSGCHPSVYRRYQATPMARSSGATLGAVPAPGGFQHGASGVTYRVTADGQLTFTRGPAQGQRELTLYIGSGAAARSFLWRRDGFLFEAPVTWYARRGWDMSPGYETAPALNLARPIEPECLGCHATGVRPRAGTPNGYQDPPFAEGGVGCERCHGPGRLHVSRAGKGAVVNPAKLAPRERNSVCAQCHLTGVERVELAGRSVADYRPGEDLAAYTVSLVWSAPQPDGVHVTSHYERLQTSGCKRGAGEKLWCGSCHDPHATPAAAARASYYRSKCLQCHGSSRHARRSPECVSCHMPSRPAHDAPHTVFTDHSIPRRAPQPATEPATGGQRELRPFWGGGGPRELGLAWARLAHREQRAEDYDRARALLEKAHAQGGRDAALLTVLGYLRDRAGDQDGAAALYERALAIDPSRSEAAVNLGAARAAKGRLDQAIPLWEDAARRSPGLEAAWIKLATAYLAAGRKDEARQAVQSCLEYHPDSPLAREILAELDP